VVAFYNRTGHAIAYVDEDGESIYLFNGKPVAYLAQDVIYGYNGHWLGWMLNGWVYDTRGRTEFFTDSATGIPATSLRAIPPLRAIRGIKPLKPIRSIPPIHSLRSANWSEKSGESFFEA